MKALSLSFAATVVAAVVVVVAVVTPPRVVVAQAQETPASMRAALMDIWRMMPRSMRTTKFANWGDGDPCRNAWTGVTCQFDVLPRQLQLGYSGLTELPDSLSALTGVEVLRLFGNELRRLPDALCKLVLLKELYVQDNVLTELPECIGALVRVHVMRVHGNRLRALPSSLGSMSALAQLHAENNELCALPSSLGALSSLHTLYVHNNRLRVLDVPVLGELVAHGALEHFTMNDNAGVATYLRGGDGVRSLRDALPLAAGVLTAFAGDTVFTYCGDGDVQGGFEQCEASSSSSSSSCDAATCMCVAGQAGRACRGAATPLSDDVCAPPTPAPTPTPTPTPTPAPEGRFKWKTRNAATGDALGHVALVCRSHPAFDGRARFSTSRRGTYTLKLSAAATVAGTLRCTATHDGFAPAEIVKEYSDARASRGRTLSMRVKLQPCDVDVEACVASKLERGVCSNKCLVIGRDGCRKCRCDSECIATSAA